MTVPTERACQCPASNPDCQHPTCPRWPLPGHVELYRLRLEHWLRHVALFSNDSRMASLAHDEYVQLTNKAPEL